MTTEQLTTAAGQLIDGFDSGAHQVIAAYRSGGRQLGRVARARWETALEQSAPQLSPETRRNAAHAQKVFGGYYARGVELSASGAEVAVGALVQAARAGVERAQTWSASRG
jgi:hypothetical protein